MVWNKIDCVNKKATDSHPPWMSWWHGTVILRQVVPLGRRPRHKHREYLEVTVWLLKPSWHFTKCCCFSKLLVYVYTYIYIFNILYSYLFVVLRNKKQRLVCMFNATEYMSNKCLETHQLMDMEIWSLYQFKCLLMTSMMKKAKFFWNLLPSVMVPSCGIWSFRLTAGVGDLDSLFQLNNYRSLCIFKWIKNVHLKIFLLNSDFFPSFLKEHPCISVILTIWWIDL